MDPCRLVAADWKRIRGDPGLVAAEQCPEWALIEARPVSAQQVNEAERELRRLALLPQEERTDQAYQEFLDACDARTDAHRNRRGPSDHAIVPELTHDAFTWGFRDEEGLASQVKSDANNLRRWVTARLRAGLLPDWVYDDDEARDDSPRLRVFLAARARMLAERDTLVGPPGPAEMLCDELARTARWAHTVESQKRDAPAQAERRWRAEQQDGPARLTMGTPARR
jgi:hypothetical protein